MDIRDPIRHDNNKEGFEMRKKRKNLCELKEIGNTPEEQAPITVDPQGSYTGVADDPWEKPVQDADDL